MAFIKFSRILKNIYIYYFSIGIIIDKISFSKILIQFKNIINHTIAYYLFDPKGIDIFLKYPLN